MTIKEIADALGISTSTVSKALNNATDVSEKTRKKVQIQPRAEKAIQIERFYLFFSAFDSGQIAEAGQHSHRKS